MWSVGVRLGPPFIIYPTYIFLSALEKNTPPPAQSNARFSLSGSKGDSKRLLRFWPCIVYETLDELLYHVQGTDNEKVLNHHLSKVPVKVVARLIAWKDRPVEYPKLLLRMDNDSSCGGYNLGEVTLVHLSGDNLDHNKEEDHGELLDFYDSMSELDP